jgi:hypothetical protein
VTARQQVRRERVLIPAVLALVLGAMVVLRPTQGAQAALGMGEDRAGYLVVSGASGQGTDHLLWILDTRSEELVLAGWDSTIRGLKGFGTRNVKADLEHARKNR